MQREISKRNTGVRFLHDGTAYITVWSPLANTVDLIIHERSSWQLSKTGFGYWTLRTDQLHPGDEYWLSIDNNEGHPDPASLSQPHGVHGPSLAVNLDEFNWTDSHWANIPLEELIIYELHTGTFSQQGNFAGIAEKLDHLVNLGINAIEIMPVAQFPGTRNWGYDGVFPFAVQQSYGGAKALQQLVDACHHKNIAVILDVVYNHIGPEGNYLPEFGPYFTDKYFTPWGKALNFDDAWCNGARDYFIENALMWFRDFHLDGLRLDAVHAIKDFSAKHLIREIREQVDLLSATSGRKHYLIAELDLNDPKFIDPFTKGGFGADAQWIDEFHHALRVASGQPREGYYADFNGISDLAKSYNDAYVFDGQFSDHRKKFFGAKTTNPGKQFIAFSQNHDQTGNRMLGERSSTLVSYEMLKLMAGAVLVSPFLPMLFMGEEWSETSPFLFFISHSDIELAALVNKGRKEEFSYFNWQGEPPDPRQEDTFIRSSLDWSLLSNEPNGTMLRYYQKLIGLRKSTEALSAPERDHTRAVADDQKQLLFLERWKGPQNLLCIMNFSKHEQEIDLQRGLGKQLLDSASPEWLGPKNASANQNGTITIQPESILIHEQQ